MATNVDAVIAALRIVLEEAQASLGYWWNVETANRWINQLPGSWTGRWRDLKLKGNSVGEVPRTDFIGHVRATLAYLEANRDAIRTLRTWSWPVRGVPSQAFSEPIDAEFKDVTPLDQKQLAKPRKSVRVVK
jgi:hypothetical protein